MLRKPAIYHGQVAFTAQSSLWIAPFPGGEARRLTSQPRSETDAAFSPDGNWLAFTAQYEGGPQVYRMPVGGGTPERLTHTLQGCFCLGWLPNDRGILVRSAAGHPQNRARLFAVPAEGGVLEPLPLPEAELAAVHPDGRIAFVPTSAEGISQRGYCGGKTDTLWLKEGDKYRRLTDGTFITTSPFWVGDLLYYVGYDETGTSNLYSLDPNSKRTAQRITHYTGTGVAYPKSDGQTVIFELGDTLVTCDLTGGSPETPQFKIPFDPEPMRARRQPISQFVAGQEFELLAARKHALYPGGERVLLELRGQILELNVTSGEGVTRLSRPGSRCTFPSPAPRGDGFVVVADLPHETDPESGPEQRLWLCEAPGECRPLTPALPGFPSGPVWSPEGNWIALADREQRILLVDASGKEAGGEEQAVRQVDQAAISMTSDDVNDSYCFSPDEQWLAYTSRAENWHGVLYLYRIATGERYALTTSQVHSSSPTFSADGKYLYFLSNLHFYRQSSGLCFLEGLGVSAAVCQLPLAKLVEFAASRAKPPAPGEEPCTQDLSELALAELEILPLRDAQPTRITVAGDVLLALNEQLHPGESSTTDLYAYPLPEGPMPREIPPLWIIPEVDEFQLSPQRDAVLIQCATELKCVQLGRSAALRGGNTHRTWVEDSSGARFENLLLPMATRTLRLPAVELEVDPVLEWRQMLRETWRFARDFFWNPYFNGVDWHSIGKQYEQRLATVTDRLELNDLLTQLLAELRASHVKVSGGDVAGFGRGLNIGYLGAELALDPSGEAWQIRRLLRNDPYDPKSRSPLRAAEISEGQYVRAINKQPVRPNADLNKLLLGCGGKPVKLEISAHPTAEAGRETKEVHALRSDLELRYQDWVETRRERVLRTAGPTVGYIPVRNLMVSGLLEFARHYFASRECRALIIDVRNNEGGNCSNTLLMHLAAKPDAFLKPRTGASYARANHGFHGTLLVLCDETTVSNAEEFCRGIQTLSLGEVVGRRTQGAGVAPITFALLDNGKIHLPNVGIWAPDGTWIVERKGVEPDIPVDYCPRAELQGDPILDAALDHLLAKERKGALPVSDQVPEQPTPRDAHPRYPDQPLEYTG